MFDLDTEKIQSLALFIMWCILLLFPAIICTGDKVCVKVSLKRAASNPVTILKSELRSDILLLSVALMLLGFFGLVPKTIKQVLWLGVSFSPLWTAHTTSKSESPSRSQSSLYSREVIPSIANGKSYCRKVKVLKVNFVSATAVQSQLFSFVTFYLIECIQEAAEFDKLAYLGTGEISYSRLIIDKQM